MLTLHTTIGQATLESRGLNFDEHFFWIAIAALFGFAIVYNIGFTLALGFLKPPGWSLAIISREKLSKIRTADSNWSEDVENRSSHLNSGGRIVFPFEPLALTFQDVQYYIDTPSRMRKKGYSQRKLQLLSNATGELRPGILTALMGTSGAGKTTLLDVLAGRKTIGCIQGEIKVGGYPKIQETFARISGYCEQNDIHSPQITVIESLFFSASLRLASHIDSKAKAEFVEEVLEIMELNEVKDALVGFPGSLVYQPLNLILLKHGGSLIYFGPLGQHSCKVIEYFESIPGVPKIKDNCNPATWMLEVTSPFVEAELGADFAQIYKKSSLYDSSLQPFVATERVVMYRERFAGMYSSWAYALAQVTIEVPYLFIQAMVFEMITYPMIGYHGSVYKVLWYFYAVFCTQLYFTFFGMLFVSLTPEVTIAGALLSAFHPLPSLFSGFLIPRPSIPGVPKVKNNCNPATWMVEVTSPSVEAELGADFAEIYMKSALYENNELVRQLSDPPRAYLYNHLLPQRVVIYRERFAGIYSSWAYALAQEFVEQVLEIMEINEVKDALVGIPGLSGLSTAQRKRLTIAVELVANPFVFLMDWMQDQHPFQTCK
ncbi:Pleiotropic drug resistance protein 3 [Hibiscus syriacus]|uniref:Pleiotropic drug resistance protein 3 n=1 Tax=Hibiscus syriacus TaxID=106335 RepID=A0A6A2YKF3_HIBSY|nr:Pleiotropic drug resistance protein 3 [Hibiscus syriacus]